MKTEHDRCKLNKKKKIKKTFINLIYIFMCLVEVFLWAQIIYNKEKIKSVMFFFNQRNKKKI